MLYDILAFVLVLGIGGLVEVALAKISMHFFPYEYD